MMIKRIALISFHTSPLATLGGKDTGGMNVFVREIARELGRRGIAVDVFTRSQSAQSLRIDPRLASNVRVIHVPAGPEAPVGKDALYEHIGAFTEWMCNFAQVNALEYDLIHANYWLSGLVAESLRACWGTKFVMTFHTLAEMKNQIAHGHRMPRPSCGWNKSALFAIRRIVSPLRPASRKTSWCMSMAPGSSKIRIVAPGMDPARFHPIEQAMPSQLLGCPAIIA